MIFNQSTNNSNTIQASWVAIGTLASFGFSIVSSMILSRYFEKVEYGTYKQVIYVYSSLLTIFTLGLPKSFSYFLPRVSLSESKNLVNKINIVLLILGCVFSLALFLGSSIIANFLKNEELSYLLKIFSPVPILMLPTMGLEGILSTYRKTYISSMYTVLTRIFMLLCVVLPVIIFKGTVTHAIIGFVLSSFLSFLLALYLKNLPFRKVNKEKTKVTYKQILDYTAPIMYAGIWGLIISSSDQFFISRYFGAEVFADFSNGSLELPFVGMIIGATSIVLTPVFSRKIHEKSDIKEDIYPLWMHVFEKTAKIIYPMVIFFFFFADIVMILMYGDNYALSGNYFRIKLIVNFFTLISYAPLIFAIGATKYYANIHMYGAIVLVLLEYVCILIFNSPYVVIMVSVACQIGRVFFALKLIANFFEVPIYKLFPIKLLLNIIIPSSVILLIIRISFHNVTISNIILLTIGFIVYGTFYCLWAYYRKINYEEIVRPIFKVFKG